MGFLDKESEAQKRQFAKDTQLGNHRTRIQTQVTWPPGGYTLKALITLPLLLS